MREIKFREWDQEREDMMPGHGMSYSEREEFDDSVGFRFEHEEDLDYTGRQSETDCHGTPYRVLEQYTGLDDINGKPIYEGDIIKSNYKYAQPKVSQIIIEDGNSYIAGEDLATGNEMLVSDHVNEIEIIGNVHTDIKLLNDNKNSIIND